MKVNFKNIIALLMMAALVVAGAGINSDCARAEIQTTLLIRGRISGPGIPASGSTTIGLIISFYNQGGMTKMVADLTNYNPAVEVKDGIFSVEIDIYGKESMLTSEKYLNFDEPYWMTLTAVVGGQSQGVSGFQLIPTVPYAYRVKAADKADYVISPLKPENMMQVIQADTKINGDITLAPPSFLKGFYVGDPKPAGGWFVDKGVVLPAEDRPMITGSYLFTSGEYTGLGTTGLFMEPYALNVAVTHIPVSFLIALPLNFNVAQYYPSNSDTAPTPLMSINTEDKGVILPATGNTVKPLITRGDNPFTSGLLHADEIGAGNKTNVVGRWGLFRWNSGTSRLIFGIPNTDAGPAYFKVSKYYDDSTKMDLLVVDNQEGSLGWGGTIYRIGNSPSVTHQGQVDLGLTSTTGNDFATVGGGENNIASQGGATICGGYGNTAIAERAVIGGGKNNVAAGMFAWVGGGESNQAWGQYSMIPGGYQNITDAAAVYSFAGGYKAHAKHKGSFVWSDYTPNVEYASNGDDTFNVRATNGVYFAAGWADYSETGGHIGRRIDEWSPTTWPSWDVAEYMDVLRSEGVREGEIVSVKADDRLGKSGSTYDELMVGIVSGKDTVTMHLGNSESLHKECVRLPVALKGRVYVRVNAENGPIQLGDYITSSSRPGVGMKATEPGPVVGIALEPFDGKSEDGKILCFAALGERNVAKRIADLQKRSHQVKARNAELRLAIGELEKQLSELLAAENKRNAVLAGWDGSAADLK